MLDTVNLTDTQLAALQRDIGDEINRRSPDSGIDFQQVKGQEMAKRALLIALAGNHSICLVGGYGVGKSMMRSAARTVNPSVRTHESRPCDCGYRGDPRRECSCEVNAIERVLRNLPAADITIEVPSVPAREMDAPERFGTSTDDIERQIADMVDRPTEMDEHSRSLLKSAIAEIGLSPRDVSTIKSIAGTIAALGRSSRIESQHMCEAINYRPLTAWLATV